MKKLYFSLITLLILFTPQVVHADGADFTLAPSQNQYQSGNYNGYFALKMPPKATTTLGITIFNTGKSTDTFDIMVNSGVTDFKTSLSYANVPTKGALSVPKNLQFSQIATIPQKKVTIAPGAQTTIQVNIALPDTSFDGKILGGITITREMRPDEKAQKGTKNQFAYAIPVVIRQNDQAITPQLQANHLSIQTKANETNLAADIQNVTATILNGVTIETKLSDQTGHVVFTKKDANHSIAPQSNFTYLASLSNQKIANGKYTYDLTITDNANHKWTWEKTLTVDQKQSQNINSAAKHNTINNPINWIIMGMIAMAIMIFLLLAAVGYLLFKRSKQKSQTK
ncbi:DUF3324 domain-containing protein [Leuconostoc lactis]|uniref:DUF3324 domain-containing protein n=1 Tax=Leuconostoc lactis TaxID=1246 RepID=UPI000814ECA3|nr:DUF3324 domain-containing protein [Leuconostoc lactis]ANY11137.1 hypothetical protein BCR17_01365 [Leuconostoc lactis]MSB65843.1 DUF3324 domain-containing protein [Leuconostoc lactis]RYS86633.1 DUF3324 domain-containing protein [Leuconostoc lactis]